MEEENWRWELEISGQGRKKQILAYLKIKAHGAEEFQVVIGGGNFEEIESVGVPFLDSIANAFAVTVTILAR